MVSTPHGADSEVGRLATVMLHRPGNELKRLTPRNNDRLLFDGIPWVSRAQDEHDAFAGALRARDVEVLYLADLLTESLAVPQARAEAVAAARVVTTSTWAATSRTVTSSTTRGKVERRSMPGATRADDAGHPAGRRVPDAGRTSVRP